jgi:hypothetical protein
MENQSNGGLEGKRLSPAVSPFSGPIGALGADFGAVSPFSGPIGALGAEIGVVSSISGLSGPIGALGDIA